MCRRHCVRKARMLAIFHGSSIPAADCNCLKAHQRLTCQMVRTWLLNEPDLAWFSQYNDRNARSYAIAADEAQKAGFIIFGHTDNAPGSLRDGIGVIEHIWGFGEAMMSPEQLQAFREGKFLTWATFLNDWSKLDGMISVAVQRGAYLNPTLHYEWGGMSKRAMQR